MSLLPALEQIFDSAQIRTDEDSLKNYGCDWTRVYQPSPAAIVFPRSADQVQDLVRFARANKVGLVPSGGRTGLSGAAVATNSEVVVSFERMNNILEFDGVDRSLRCEAGVITETLQNAAVEKGLFYPVDFGSRGSSAIGGNIATNAGGIKVVRYGLTRDWVTGLKVVTGKGEILELNRGLIKNASGYDLRHLFIGSEGTLGFIVEATLKLSRPPQNPTVMVLGVPDLDSIMAIFGEFQQRLSLNAFEYFSDKALSHVMNHGAKQPIESRTPYYVLLEFDQVGEKEEAAALEAFEVCGEKGLLEDGVISQSEGQSQALWGLRENISESISPFTPYKNDVSVRISRVPQFIHEVDEILTREYPDYEVVWYGHIGDGNLHINILKPGDLALETFVEECQRVNKILFDVIRKHEGSISAEHGVGLTKKPYLEYTRPAEEVAYLRGIKQVFDPDGVMNPGKVFD